MVIHLRSDARCCQGRHRRSWSSHHSDRGLLTRKNPWTKTSGPFRNGLQTASGGWQIRLLHLLAAFEMRGSFSRHSVARRRRKRRVALAATFTPLRMFPVRRQSHVGLQLSLLTKFRSCPSFLTAQLLLSGGLYCSCMRSRTDIRFVDSVAL